MTPTRTKVIIINGVTGSGKDTFIEFVQSYCQLNEVANILNISSVDTIKNVLRQFGWDGNRTDEARDIMMGIKKIWIDAQNGPTMFLLNNIIAFHASHVGEDNIIFCHVREPEEIEKLERAVFGMDSVGIDVMTMLIVRDDAIKDDTRRSDDYEIIKSYPYSKIIENDKDLIALDRHACLFVEQLFD